MTPDDKTTHFGFQSVAWDEKQNKVDAVFHSVAKNYDIMNDLMSFGIHRLWKQWTLAQSGVRTGQVVLDLAGGSGDLTKVLSQKVGNTGCVLLADINASMLSVARNRLLDEGFYQNIEYIQANAESLPFASNEFDCITMAFGLRNVTDKNAALASIYRTCKPGGKLMVLEFSKPNVVGLESLYDWYSFHILPKIGQWVAQDADSYQYLAESIRMHPNQETLCEMMMQAGFEDVRHQNLTGGIVALHVGYKY